MKYTIVYNERIPGTLVANHQITKFDRIECEQGDLIKKFDNYDGVWFVFEGWPKLEGEA